ncbi:MAG: glutamate--tRNA ligase [Deltaproteobacteria bacterium HGW-Deltaproteobacteria-14]|jgi:glutamyl-tRNA synthetase|nr:MAG: glutamate--tRNA ligase [Deltaproteobacteria bacterium HGW-Deltaproteobacteria-14]
MTVEIPIPTDRPVRVRIAPSPTGEPHVGTAYIALFNKVFAEKNNGRFILRIEDTDQRRSTPESEQAILDSLRWLGLDWHEGPDIGGPYGPYRQSERTELYREHAKYLIDEGNAYYCFATSEELDEMRATAKEQGLRTAYDRRYRDLPREEVERRLAAGEPYVVRLKMPLSGTTRVTDGLRGDIDIDNAELDDQILLKSDGFPTYHLANVVDDRLMQITHVIRAEEWIPSTPKHVLLYQAFGWEPPVFIHMPLLRNNDKTKISKRKNPVSLEYYRTTGYLPEALVNFLARMGWSMPDESEKFEYREMLEHFDFGRMSLGGPIFDLDKLDWLNGMYIRELEPGDLVARLQGWLLGSGYLSAVAPLVRERIKRLGDFIPSTTFFFGGFDPLPAEALVPKGKERVEAYRALRAVTEAVDSMSTWDEATIEEALRAQVEATGFKVRDLFMMVRLAVTSQKATPPLFESMAVIGKARCQYRLREATNTLKP